MTKQSYTKGPMQEALDAETLPTFLELAENKLAWAHKRDKTINIKIAINTARMMVKESQDTAAERDRLRKALKAINDRTIDLHSQSKAVRDRAANDIDRWSATALAKVKG